MSEPWFLMHEYGDSIAEIYDEVGGAPADTDDTVRVIAALCGGGGRALEFGVGTGRVALPLREKVSAVDGIEISSGMRSSLLQKRGSLFLGVVSGDFAVTVAEPPYEVIYCVFNSLLSQLDQASQVRTFCNARQQLTSGGHFVVEVLVPDPSMFDGGQRTHVFGIEKDCLDYSATIYDAVSQRVRIQRVRLSSGSLKLLPLEYRLIWPAELDLMARLAGFELEGRYADWNLSPFVSSSVRNVSIYKVSGGVA